MPIMTTTGSAQARRSRCLQGRNDLPDDAGHAMIPGFRIVQIASHADDGRLCGFLILRMPRDPS